MSLLPVRSKEYLVKAPFQFREEEKIISNIPPGHYLVKLVACGVCHSDLLWASHRAQHWEKIGHEFGGKIIEHGEKTNFFVIGQQVAVKNASPCGKCIECIKGQPRFCSNIIINKSGHDTFFIADERSLVDAEGIPPHLLGIVEPLGVAYDMVSTADVTLGDNVIIYGLGVIGLLVGRLCKQKGAASVVGVARGKKYFALAEQFGFSGCFQAETPDLSSIISRSFSQRGNKILLCAPPQCLNLALPLLSLEGKLVMVGLYEGPWNSESSLNFEELIFKRASITGVFAYPNLFFSEAIRQIRNDTVMLTKIISDVRALETIPETFQNIAKNPGNYFKVVFSSVKS